MRSPLIALLSIATLVQAEVPHAALQAAVPAPGPQQVAPAPQRMLTVPAGTTVPLTLINPIKKKSTRVGDAVRATVAFPVMAGMQVAIPAGSYVEGTVTALKTHASASMPADLSIHFDRLVFASGYSVPLNADNTQAENFAPTPGAPVAELASLAPVNAGGLFAQTTTPTLPPLQRVGPSPAVVTGAVLGGGAALTVLLIALGHHQQNKYDYVLFDAGWQFQMVLASPLSIDAGKAVPPVL